MSLDSQPLYLRNVILISLSIERIEYCYFLPILLQLAEYWGDVKMISLCKIMLKQLRQNLNHITYLHFLLSGHLKQKNLFLQEWPHVSNNIKVEKDRQQFQLSQIYKNPKICIEISNYFVSQKQIFKRSQNQENIVLFSNLEIMDNIFYHFLEDVENKFEYQLANNKFQGNFFFAKNIVKKEDYLKLLNCLQRRKLWKAEYWYPLISKLLSSQNVLGLSHNFIQFSQSEKNMSQILFILINK